MEAAGRVRNGVTGRGHAGRAWGVPPYDLARAWDKPEKLMGNWLRWQTTESLAIVGGRS